MIQKKLIKKQRAAVLILLLLVIITAMAGLATGYAPLNISRILPALAGHGTFKEQFILFDVRLPRMIITLLAGMALAVSGAILQGISRNDLADPGIIGINAGAGTAVAVFFLFFPVEAGSFIYMLPLVACLGGLATAALIYPFAYEKGRGLVPVRLVLVGIGFATALGGLMVILMSSSDSRKVDFIAKWLAGNIWGTDWPFILAFLPWLIVLLPIVWYKANRLDLLSLNEASAVALGLSIERERAGMLLIAVALAASAVSVTGGISFVGLIAPHIAKSIVGPRARLYLPVTMLFGGWMLLLADTIGRNLVEPEGIPAGTVAAMIGAPYFIYLLLKK